MSLTRNGSIVDDTIAIDQPNNSLRVSKTGAARLTARAKCNVSAFPTIVPSAGQAHPNFSTLFLREFDFTTLPGGLILLELNYEGYISPLPPAVWSVGGSTGEEPIRLNPNWAALKTLAQDNNGYVEDENGAFVEFTAPEELAGVQSSLAPRVVLTQRYVTTVFPTSELAALRTIDAPPTTGTNGWDEIPAMTTGAENWFKINFESVDLGFGEAYEITNQWLKSGPNGWSETIYGGTT